MTRPPPSQPAVMTPGQTVGWAALFAVLAGLLAMFFAFDTAATPLFDVTARGAAWPLS